MTLNTDPTNPNPIPGAILALSVSILFAACILAVAAVGAVVR